MAAQTWEEILVEARLSAEEQKVIDNIVKRVPEFKDGRMRQSDYSRQSLEIQKQKKDYDEAVAYSQRMKAWADEKVPVWESAVEKGLVDEEGNFVWLQEKERLAKELTDAKAKAVGGADMDPAELKKTVEEVVKAYGPGLTKDELAALISSEAQKLSKQTFDTEYEKVKAEFNGTTIPFTMAMAANNSLAAKDYETVTGEEWSDEKQKELYALMTKENNMNPRAAMKMMLKPVLDKKAADADFETKYQERLAKERKAQGVEDGPYIPIPGVNQPKGSLQAMLDASAAEGDVESIVMAAGRKAAAELRTEGKY